MMPLREMVGTDYKCSKLQKSKGHSTEEKHSNQSWHMVEERLEPDSWFYCWTMVMLIA
jgi:hypothetical protein